MLEIFAICVWGVLVVVVVVGGYCESGLDLGCEPVPDWCQVSLSQSPAWLPDPNQRTEGSCPAQNPPTFNCYKTSHLHILQEVTLAESKSEP